MIMIGGFTVCYSYDNKNWKRLKNTKVNLKNNTLSWNINQKKHYMVCLLPTISLFKK